MTEQATRPRIAVLIKQVPDINGVRVDPVARTATLPAERVMNTYDVYAVSEALSVRDRVGGTVTAVTAGPPEAREVLVRALATGVDDAIHIDLPHPNDHDSLVTAGIIADVLRERGFDLVLAGQSTDDYETGQVGPQVAELLGWPHVSLVTHVEVEDRAIRVRRDAEASKEVISVPMPAVLMILSGRDAEQRYPTLRGMMAAKKKPIEDVPPGQLPASSRIWWSEPKAAERSAGGILIQGKTADEAAAELVAWLTEQKLI